MTSESGARFSSWRRRVWGGREGEGAEQWHLQAATRVAAITMRVGSDGVQVRMVLRMEVAAKRVRMVGLMGVRRGVRLGVRTMRQSDN